MATYKVLQDIEAEDKLIGPLTLRQCIYAAIAVVGGYLSYLAIAKGASFLTIVFLPFIAFGLFFAFPWTKQQTTEVWALAKIRFALKPRRRVWDQSGVKDLVTVTAPKKLEDPRINAISETEVRSRLRALADTIDSRGWAIKNVPLNLYTGPVVHPASDRLIDAPSVPMEVPTFTTTASDDIFDFANNPVAQQFDQKISAATTARRQQLEQVVDHPELAQAAQAAAAPGTPQNAWYAAQMAATMPGAAPYQAPMPIGIPQAANPTPEEEAIAAEIRRKQELMDSQAGHWHTVQPLSAQTPQSQADPVVQQPLPPLPYQVQPTAYEPLPDQFRAEPLPPAPSQPAVQNPPAPVTPTPNPAILELANNNDLNVATIAREANHLNSDTPDEVVVPLH